MDVKILDRANDIMKRATEGYVGVIDSEGYPNVATRSLIRPANVLSCYFSTGTGANLMKRIEANNKASVCVREEGSNISLHGEVEIVTDMAVKKQMWLDWFINHYPGGPEDPIYCLLKFTTKRATFWIDGEYVEAGREELEKL